MRSESKQRILNLGVAGCGYIFRAVYGPLLKQMPDRVRLAAAADPGESGREQAREFFPEIRVYEDAAAMLAREKLDAVLVFTSEIYNAPVSIGALQAGLPVYLEKPPASTLEQLDALELAERESGAAVFTAFNRRFTPLFRDWRIPSRLKAVRGSLIRHNRRVDSFPYTGVHLIDAAQYFAGSLLKDFEVIFSEGENGAEWEVRGRLENGAECELRFLPTAGRSDEQLSFESGEGIWSFDFANTEARLHRHGALTFRDPVTGERRVRGGHEAGINTSMGFMGMLDEFLSRTHEGSLGESIHRLPRVRPTVRLMEEMMGKAGLLQSC